MTTKSDHEKLWIEYGIDLEKRSIMLDEDVDDTTVGTLIRGIKVMEARSTTKPIHVYINTYGGSVYDGLALYDVLINSPAPIYTYGLGKVMSMGTILVLAGDKKFSYKRTSYMWHTISSISVGKLFDIKGETEEADRLWNELVTIYGEQTNKPASHYKKWLKYEDRYGDAELAKKLGFVDEIL